MKCYSKALEQSPLALTIWQAVPEKLLLVLVMQMQVVLCSLQFVLLMAAAAGAVVAVRCVLMAGHCGWIVRRCPRTTRTAYKSNVKERKAGQSEWDVKNTLTRGFLALLTPFIGSKSSCFVAMAWLIIVWNYARDG